MRLRPRTRADLETIVGWIPDARALYLFTGPVLSWPVRADDIERVQVERRASAWVMVEDEDASDVLGHVDLSPDEDALRLGRVIVSPAHRGRGLGRELTRLALRAAKELGAERVSLNVIDGNQAAIRTYAGLGFTADGSGGDDAIRMTRALDDLEEPRAR